MVKPPKKRKKKMRVSTPGKRFKIQGRNPVFMSGVKVVKGKEGAMSFGTGPCFTLVFQLRGKLSRERGPRGVRRRWGEPTSVVWHVTSSHASEGEGRLDGREEVAKKLRMGELPGYETEGFHPKTVTDGILDYLHGNSGVGAHIVVTAIPGRVTLEERGGAEAMGEMMELLRRYKEDGRIHNLRTRGLSKSKGSPSTHVDSRGRINREALGPRPKVKKDGQA